MTSPAPPDAAPAIAPAPLPARIESILSRAARDLGSPHFDTGERAALRRLDPHAPSDRIGAVCRLLANAGADLIAMGERELIRWRLVIHAMALMSGPGRSPREAAGGNFSKRDGARIFEAGVSEARFRRLLNARGDAFVDQVVRIARLVAARGVTLDWTHLARLILNEGRDEDRADQARLDLARQFYSAEAARHRAEAKPDSQKEDALR